jgi:hypothetical protein
MSDMKLKQTMNNGPVTAKVYWNRTWEEYQVKLFYRGEYKEDAEYFSDSLTDAVCTAERMLKEWEPDKIEGLTVIEIM